jgi:hypothetical protein
MPLLKEPVGEMGTKEAGATGNKDTHNFFKMLF